MIQISDIPIFALSFELLKYKETSAIPSRAFLSEPEKITSSDFFPRKSFKLCSPKTHLAQSAILLFPDPFGPTIAVIPGLNSKSTL